MDTNSLILLAIAMFNAFAAYMAYRTKLDVGLVKAATDGMKDALVARTADMAKLVGRDEMRVESELKAAAVAEGVKQGAAVNAPAERKLELLNQPLPVADSRTAAAAERTATSSERIAGAAERTADKESKS